MAVNPSNFLALRNAIKNQLISEIAPPGRLQGVVSIGDAWLNDTTIWPYISVVPDSGKEKITATRRKESDINFIIGMAYKSTISLEDAYDHLYTLADDGNGNGLMAILRDPNHYTWGNLASFSEIQEWKFYDNIDDTKNAALTNFGGVYCSSISNTPIDGLVGTDTVTARFPNAFLKIAYCL